jgi:uncharacterized membrane protein
MHDPGSPPQPSRPRGLLKLLPGRQPVAIEDDELGLERIIFFSDAVFAIAITLLAQEIRLPVAAEGGPVTWEDLLGLWPKMLSYVISFVTIGGYWVSHHRKFRLIRGYDRRLIWINLLALAAVAFLPFPTALLGEHGDEVPTAIFYAVTVIITGLLFTGVWVYATQGRRLLAPDVDEQVIRQGSVRALVPILCFAASIPVAVLVHPYAAEVIWGLSALVLLRV